MSSLSILRLRTWRREPGTVRARRHSPMALWLSLAFWALLVVCALVPELLATSDPLGIYPERVLKAPSLEHPFGTDQYGRDVLSQIVHGTGISILVGLVSTTIAAAAGTIVGVVSGHSGGIIDAIIMRFIDVLLCFPGILLALVFQAALGPGRANVVLAVAIAAAPTYARLVRGTTMSISNRTFVLASRSAGVREGTILRRHVAPFVLAPVLSVATIGLGTAIVLAASLSFLGLGSEDGIADWGQLIGSGQPFLGTAWWIVTAPGIVITLVVVTAGIIGDELGRRLNEGSK